MGAPCQRAAPGPSPSGDATRANLAARVIVVQGTGQAHVFVAQKEPAITRPTWPYHLAMIIPVIAVSVGLLVATPAAAVDTRGRAFVGEALTLVNQERAKARCASLRIVPRLQAAAEQQSWDQADRDRFGHDGANGSTVNSRLGRLGYSRWAENVVQAQNAQTAVRFWSDSPRHRMNMRNCAYRETGLALARSNSGRLYWTETFGGR
jgi:uncharacterized protein YkwD